MVVWLVFGREITEVVDAGMDAIVGETPSSGLGEDVVGDAAPVAIWTGARLGFVASLGWVDKRGIGSLAAATSIQSHNKIFKARTLLLVLRS